MTPGSDTRPADEAALTRPLADAIAEGERIIRGAPFVRSEQDLVEGLDYLAGCIKQAIGSSWGHEKDFPYFVRSATQYTKVGLDNPDTLYFSARIRDGAEYVVTGQRGTTTDVTFQILGGDYTPEGVPASLAAFDDRDIGVAEDGSFEVRFGPARADAPANYVALDAGASMLLVREVSSDWTATTGTVAIARVDNVGAAPAVASEALLGTRFASAGRSLISGLKTFLAFPEWFYLKLPVNTMAEPRLTPGGLATQWSSVGHYDLTDDEALIVTVPVSEAPYQGFQLGTMWYISMDFANHQTSLTADQAHRDPDGLMRFVVSERDPGLANWLECTGHPRGYLQIRWQRTSRPYTAADGPTVEKVAFDSLPQVLPHYEQARMNPQQWHDRIAARQAAVANRMLG